MEMLLTGKFVSAEEAERFGLINVSVPLDQLETETRKLARNIAQSSRHTLASGKRAFYEQVDLDEASAYNYAKEVMALNCLAEDAREGIAAFIEKRKPRWSDR
jgi:enoyl-CoA hydratase/carnithine racemase